ncbi:MAG TPA: vitamin B12-dependent ribonucleotide reductase [Candidatus Saccharimonadales bacterium]|nr:vitamin B12-dependent ribonucleotide reductase [Candidatus Saccharimonadales bacterium]
MAGTMQQRLDQDSGLVVRRVFTTPGADPFDSVEWEKRTALIGDPDNPSFKQKNVEFPKTWSLTATNIVSQKYFRGQLDKPARENSVKQMIGRVAGTIAAWGQELGYFATEEDGNAFRDELTHILLHQYAAFNSPVWFNVGFEEQPQCSACFILSTEDEMDDILFWNTQEGKIFRGGSGSGINLSKIRGSMEPLSKGGTASGPVSFMLGADAWAGVIKSGGKTRRAAKMVVLEVDHPDILHFARCKADAEDFAKELDALGYDVSVDGKDRWRVPFQNANNSIRVTDDFMSLVEGGETAPWQVRWRIDGSQHDVVDPETGQPMTARELMVAVADAAWRCADPGIQFDTIINQWHTCPNSGRINASNPCSEYMHVDDSACNLASLRLTKFRLPDGTFDVATMRHVVDIVYLAQEIIVGPSSYPTEKIGDNARAFRQLGLGYADLGAYLMQSGLPYDSDEGRGLAAAITALMTGRAYLNSARFAEAVGPYDRYEENREPHNNVMRMHRDASREIEHCSDSMLLAAAQEDWEAAVAEGEINGYRNAQATVLAPTGTISFLMDCDTTGVEPDFSLVKLKDLVGGGRIKMVNQSVRPALESLGYKSNHIDEILEHLDAKGDLSDAPHLSDDHLPVFDVAVGARAISHMGHIKMMGSVQPFISGAISKTVNLPAKATAEDVMDAYIQAWKHGVKALALYVDGSKAAQAYVTVGGKKQAAKAAYTPSDVEAIVAKAIAEAGPRRNRMPKERQSLTHKAEVAGFEWYITAGLYEDGTVGEIFLTDIGKEGSTLRGMMNSFATAISIALQYGVPLETLVYKFSHMKFEPEGITRNPEIPFAKSMPDYIMRWLASRYMRHEPEHMEALGIQIPELAETTLVDGAAGEMKVTEVAPSEVPSEVKANETAEMGSSITAAPSNGNHSLPGLELGPACSQCGGMMQRTGSCYTCNSCGNNTGCG